MAGKNRIYIYIFFTSSNEMIDNNKKSSATSGSYMCVYRRNMVSLLIPQHCTQCSMCWRGWTHIAWPFTINSQCLSRIRNCNDSDAFPCCLQAFYHLNMVSKNKEREKEAVSHTGQALTYFHVTCEKQRESLMAVIWLEGNSWIADLRFQL